MEIWTSLSNETRSQFSNQIFRSDPWLTHGDIPLILIPSILLKGLHPLTLKLPGLFFFAGFLFCLYLLTEERLSRTERLILVSLFAFNPILTKHLDYIMSDIPFLFSAFLTLLLIERLKTKSDIQKHAIIGISIFFAFFLRTTGIILLGSFLAYQAVIFLSQKEVRKKAIINSAIVGTVFVVLWIISNAIFPNGQGAYFRQLMGFTLEEFHFNQRPQLFLFRRRFSWHPSWVNMDLYLLCDRCSLPCRRMGTSQKRPAHSIVLYLLLFGHGHLARMAGNQIRLPRSANFHLFCLSRKSMLLSGSYRKEANQSARGYLRFCGSLSLGFSFSIQEPEPIQI